MIGDLVLIKENLSKIKYPSMVNGFFIKKVEKGICLSALMTDGTEIQITKTQSVITFPFSPMKKLNNLLGDCYMRQFIICDFDYSCINKNNISNLTCAKIDKNHFVINVTFTNNQKKSLAYQGYDEKTLKKELQRIRSQMSVDEQDLLII